MVLPSWCGGAGLFTQSLWAARRGSLTTHLLRLPLARSNTLINLYQFPQVHKGQLQKANSNIFPIQSVPKDEYFPPNSLRL